MTPKSCKGEWNFDIHQSKFSKLTDKCSLYSLPSLSMEHQQIVKHVFGLQSGEIKSIDLIQTVSTRRVFHNEIEKCEERQKEPEFQVNLSQLPGGPQRVEIKRELEKHVSRVDHNRGVSIVRAWHGTSLESAHKILKNGFANLATLDDGWFGKGIYFTTHPEYGFHYCKNKSQPCLILCYVIMFNPYPVIWDDAKSTDPNEMMLLGKANYRNFGCHYVPVIKYDNFDFRPPQPGKKAEFDELVIFQESHILPYALVSVQKKKSPAPIPSATTSTSTSSKSVEKWSVDDVANWVANLSLSKDYGKLIKDQVINGEALLTLKTNEDWKEAGVAAFGDLRILVKRVNEFS